MILIIFLYVFIQDDYNHNKYDTFYTVDVIYTNVMSLIGILVTTFIAFNKTIFLIYGDLNPS